MPKLDKHVYSVKEVADILGTAKSEIVYRHIASGALEAVNISIGEKPRWVVFSEAIEKFLEERKNRPRITKQRRREKAPTYSDFEK